MDEHTVGEAARVAHITVRTLHHYDEIGLLRPSGRSAAGYRLYSARDLTRLHQILSYRALGFGLGEIAEMLADPDDGVDDHLRRQHRLLRDRIAQDQELLKAVEKQMEARNMGIALTPEQQFEIFGTTKFAENVAEAEKQWGETEWWQEASRRAAAFTAEDWAARNAEAHENTDKFVAAMRAGEPSNGATAVALAEELRLHWDRWACDCDPETHRRLSEHFLFDPKNQALYEDVEPGFARYVYDAIVANAERAAEA